MVLRHDLEFGLRLQRNVVKHFRRKLLLADRAVAVGPIPQHDAFFAKLVATKRENAEGEGRLADDAQLGLLRVLSRVLERQYCKRVSSIPAIGGPRATHSNDA